MQWYGDNSELNGIWDSKIPDILLFGGFAIQGEEINKLKKLIEAHKRMYSRKADFPLKYNLRDLKRWYEIEGQTELYAVLLNESKNWRSDLLTDSLSIKYKIIVSCINFHSNKAEKIKSNKENVVRYAFSNALMRVALLVRESTSGCEVFLDWPDGRNHTPFTEEYRSAYYKGCCHTNPEIQYYSGALKYLGFSESIYFAKMEECSLLQFCDLILGVTRDFIDYCLGRKDKDHFGVNLAKKLVPKYRGYPGRIIGHGIVVSPSGGDLSRLLLRGMYSLRYKSTAQVKPMR